MFPLKNVTVPPGNVALGSPANAALVIVAVSVTLLPCTAPFAGPLRTVAVVAGVIVKATGDEVLGLKLLSPLYEAVNEWCPGANQGYPFGKANEPWLFKPKYVVKGTPLSLKVINPVGVP